jgi:hypothetical protein
MNPAAECASQRIAECPGDEFLEGRRFDPAPDQDI